uniref:uncharacterized protein LOC122591541 n=1 Tax=Erigeron canadensis TaxID=72917 RepID=UPI001CB96404|nr:uncharacterized protein LOC122591541 [Erigeron canadensis]
MDSSQGEDRSNRDKDKSIVNEVIVEREDITCDFISEQIGKALENFSPFIIKKLNKTLEGAMNDYIAHKIKEEVASSVQEEFDKRFPKDQAPEIQTHEVQVKPTMEKPYDLKNFTIAKPPKYNGDPDPIVSTRWVNEIEGAFRITKTPPEDKTLYGSSMLVDRAKLWWDSEMVKKGEDAMIKMDWADFKVAFFKEFRSEADVTRLRSEFMNDSQGSMNVNEFRVRFLDKAQFCPMDVARWHEVEQGMPDEDSLKRKVEQSDSPNKKFRPSGSSGSSSSRRNVPTCTNCGKHHSGFCRLPPKKGFFNCGQPGHISRDCKVAPRKPTVCFNCFNEGHMKSACPLLSEEE